MRVLCLHGYSHSAYAFRTELLKLEERLYNHHGIELVYIDSPLCCDNDDESEIIGRATKNATPESEAKNGSEQSIVIRDITQKLDYTSNNKERMELAQQQQPNALLVDSLSASGPMQVESSTPHDAETHNECSSKIRIGGANGHADDVGESSSIIPKVPTLTISSNHDKTCTRAAAEPLEQTIVCRDRNHPPPQNCSEEQSAVFPVLHKSMLLRKWYNTRPTLATQRRTGLPSVALMTLSDRDNCIDQENDRIVATKNHEDAQKNIPEEENFPPEGAKDASLRELSEERSPNTPAEPKRDFTAHCESTINETNFNIRSKNAKGLTHINNWEYVGMDASLFHIHQIWNRERRSKPFRGILAFDQGKFRSRLLYSGNTTFF